MINITGTGYRVKNGIEDEKQKGKRREKTGDKTVTICLFDVDSENNRPDNPEGNRTQSKHGDLEIFIVVGLKEKVGS